MSVSGLLLSFALGGVAVMPSSSGVESLPADTVRLDELTVTSIKQDKQLFSLPVAASIVSGEELRRLNAVSIKGISDVVPNFYIPDYGSRITSSIYVRGLGARMDQPAVGLNVDNVPFLNKDAYDFDLTDIVSVEMLRGPQSTLYGRNTMGGQINVTTLSPLDYQGVRLNAELSGGGSLSANAGYYVRPTSNFGLALVGRYSHVRGFFRNEYDGKYLDWENSGGIRLKADWKPSSSVRILNALSLSILSQGGYPYENIPTGKISYNNECFYKRFLLNDGLTVRWKGEYVALSSITSLQYINDNMTLDQDFLPLDYFTLTQKKHELGLTQDIILRPSHQVDTYSWLAGIFGFYKHLNMAAPVTFRDYGIARLIEDKRNDANPQYPIEWDERSFLLNSDFTLPVFGLAAYHESKLTLGRWNLTAGIRFEYERPVLHYTSSCHTGYTIYDDYELNHQPLRHVPVDIDDSGRLHKNFFSMMPKVGVLYNIGEGSPLERSNLYLNISRGYKAGGFNTQMFSDVLQQRLMGIMGIGASYDVDEIVAYKPESSWNFEVGTHLAIPAARFSAEAALFYIECRDQQLTMFPDGLTTGRIMTNAGKTRSCGGEVALKWSPVEQLSFNASYGYTNARFRKFFDGIHDYSGKFLPYAPLNTLFLQSLYDVSLGAGKLARSLLIDVNLRGTGDIYWNEQNSVRQNFYALLGAALTLSGDNYSLQLWAKNITDTKYHTFYFVSIGNEFVQRGKPFTLGLTLSWHL
ncbi:MAG: TonB-dependent receptor [Bacteroidales bacterium]|nr:TonB-dependent receptor [Bacteroidales bacterium]